MLLATPEQLDSQRAVVDGPLARLADSLADDLDRLLPDGKVKVPDQKARMTRHGGRCARDGTLLLFDPRRPDAHDCPVCGTTYTGDDHYRWWIMGYQLWLAERAVHAAALWRLRGSSRYRTLAETIVRDLANVYLRYPNEDNVLGPGRVFFSTYLESIWLLQLSLAVSLLEDDGPSAIGQTYRDRILEPSTGLIASYDEGLSNRQVWNAAALGAAGVLLGRPALLDRALNGGTGLAGFLHHAVLADGTWYEGENYHLFAHRGLWHLVALAGRVGAALPHDLMRRFDLGFVAPLRTALPDFTFPARRDSHYRASLRQWRIAESLELGRARHPDSEELTAGLTSLYQGGADGDAARWRSTAEAERNVAGVRLTRADLGWKALLFAIPEPPSGTVVTPASALLDGQGLAVIRQDQGRTYVALDYGHSGGSHGHPDRLNLWLVLGDRRVFEDVGTGSYVEKTLHWYRSTLAHNAPLVEGRSQRPVTGVLRAWDVRDGYTWVDAEAAIAPDVLVRRTMVVGPGHLVDRCEWIANRPVTFDLPLHLDAELDPSQWTPGTLSGESGLEDGFAFLAEPETSEGLAGPVSVGAPGVQGAVQVTTAHAWWRAKAPGPPGEGARRFLLLRAVGARGVVTSVWSWSGPVRVHTPEDGVLDASIAGSTIRHRLSGSLWHVRHGAVDVGLDGRRDAPFTSAPTPVTETPARATTNIPMIPAADDRAGLPHGIRFVLGRANYRRTESTWEDAGSPTAIVVVVATTRDLLIEITVNQSNPHFADARDENPLDNEHPDVNSDGVQIHLRAPGLSARGRSASWLLVPEPLDGRVRASVRDDASSLPLDATWSRTEQQWTLLVRIPRNALGAPDAQFGLDVIVNEMPPGRERRRGQLVLSGAGSGWAWLRGDRQDRDALLPMRVGDG
jgi:hypothetical protein